MIERHYFIDFQTVFRRPFHFHSDYLINGFIYSFDDFTPTLLTCIFFISTVVNDFFSKTLRSEGTINSCIISGKQAKTLLEKR